MSKRTQPNTSNDDVGSFVLGLLFGSLAGAAAALWYAPQSGKQTRHTIQETSEHALESVVNEAEDVVDQVRHRIEGESIDESLEAGKAEARRFREYTTP